jgi:hypothetical protein
MFSGQAPAAVQAIGYRSKTFDAAKAATAGFETERGRLLAAVRQFCVDRSNNSASEIVDEDLAIALYVVTQNSFRRNPVPYLQWTCP